MKQSINKAHWHCTGKVDNQTNNEGYTLQCDYNSFYPCSPLHKYHHKCRMKKLVVLEVLQYNYVNIGRGSWFWKPGKVEGVPWASNESYLPKG